MVGTLYAKSRGVVACRSSQYPGPGLSESIPRLNNFAVGISTTICNIHRDSLRNSQHTLSEIFHIVRRRCVEPRGGAQSVGGTCFTFCSGAFLDCSEKIRNSQNQANSKN